MTHQSWVNKRRDLCYSECGDGTRQSVEQPAAPHELTAAERELRLAAIVNVLGFDQLHQLESFIVQHGQVQLTPLRDIATLDRDRRQLQASLAEQHIHNHQLETRYQHEIALRIETEQAFASFKDTILGLATQPSLKRYVSLRSSLGTNLILRSNSPHVGASTASPSPMTPTLKMKAQTRQTTVPPLSTSLLRSRLLPISVAPPHPVNAFPPLVPASPPSTSLPSLPGPATPVQPISTTSNALASTSTLSASSKPLRIKRSLILEHYPALLLELGVIRERISKLQTYITTKVLPWSTIQTPSLSLPVFLSDALLKEIQFPGVEEMNAVESAEGVREVYDRATGTLKALRAGYGVLKEWRKSVAGVLEQGREEGKGKGKQREAEQGTPKVRGSPEKLSQRKGSPSVRLEEKLGQKLIATTELGGEDMFPRTRLLTSPRKLRSPYRSPSPLKGSSHARKSSPFQPLSPRIPSPRSKSSSKSQISWWQVMDENMLATPQKKKKKFDLFPSASSIGCSGRVPEISPFLQQENREEELGTGEGEIQEAGERERERERNGVPPPSSFEPDTLPDDLPLPPASQDRSLPFSLSTAPPPTPPQFPPAAQSQRPPPTFASVSKSPLRIVKIEHSSLKRVKGWEERHDREENSRDRFESDSEREESEDKTKRSRKKRKGIKHEGKEIKLEPSEEEKSEEEEDDPHGVKMFQRIHAARKLENEKRRAEKLAKNPSVLPPPSSFPSSTLPILNVGGS